MLIALLALAGLALFLARFLGRSSALMPLVAVAVAMLWFLLAGCLNVLVLGGWTWYALCALALGWVIFKEKKKVVALFTPGFLFFVGGGVLFILLFYFTQPLLTQWDEFTYWGTAAKITVENNALYTAVSSNQSPSSYPQGLIVFNYMMQFFGPWGEHKMMAAYAVLQLAALAAPAALWQKNRAGAFVFLGGMFALPFFFEVSGFASWSFLSCMADAPMAALFGGALCLYFAGGEKDHKLLLALFAVLMALTNVKDMGFALALIVLFVVVLDMVFCERKTMRFFTLRRLWGVAAVFVAGVVLIVGVYALYALYLSSVPQAVDRFDFGNAQGSLGPVAMLASGLGALFGLREDVHFWDTFGRMTTALFDSARPVSLIGPGVVVLALILMVCAAAWVFSTTKNARRRVLVFTLSMAFCFAAFYLFNIFTYTYILKGNESAALKDYHRYIYPFWMGWFMGALCLLSGAAADKRALRLRVQCARAASLGLSVMLVLVCVWRGNREANFLLVSPSLYDVRHSVQQTVRDAQAQGMQPQDTVYPIIQGDNAARFYMLGYEMKAQRGFLYSGEEKAPVLNSDGSAKLDEKGKPVTETLYKKATAASLVSPQDESGYYEFALPCTPQQLVEYLKQEGSTHLLLDWPDEYIQQEFGSLFSDGMRSWVFDPVSGITPGHRYYRIVWQEDGSLCFVPQQEAGT